MGAAPRAARNLADGPAHKPRGFGARAGRAKPAELRRLPAERRIRPGRDLAAWRHFRASDRNRGTAGTGSREFSLRPRVAATLGDAYRPHARGSQSEGRGGGYPRPCRQDCGPQGPWPPRGGNLRRSPDSPAFKADSGNSTAAEEACRRAIAGHLLTTKPAEPLNLTRNSLDFCQTSAQGWVVETPPQGGRPV